MAESFIITISLKDDNI